MTPFITNSSPNFIFIHISISLTRLNTDSPLPSLGKTMGQSEILAHGARMEPASYLALFKSSSIGGPRANDEVGSAARERPQMKSVNGMCIITSSTNHQRQLQQQHHGS
jgi:hypothetical protein